MSTLPSGEPACPTDPPAPAGPLRRADWWLMLAFFAACFLTRLPLWPGMVTNPDGAECAFALDHFNVAVGHPHPPGYLLYVYSAKVFYRLGLGANHSLLLTSTLFSALACGLIYALGT